MRAKTTPWIPSMALLVLLVYPALALGQEWDDDDEEEDEGVVERVIYQYTDDHGVTYMVDDLNRVPLEYRTETRLKEIRQRVRVDEEEERPPKNPPDPSERRPRLEDPEEKNDPDEVAKVVPPAERIAELESRRDHLRERLALLEEGFADPGQAEMDGDQLIQLLADTEGELKAIDAELEQLRGADPTD
jgi:hypothetical protein